MSNVSLSEEMYVLQHNTQNGGDARPILNSVLEKLNNTDGDVSALYDGENLIRANNLLTYQGAENVLKNKLTSNVFKYSPIGKATTDIRSVDIFVDDIPKKESYKKLPMTSRGIYTQLSYMDMILEKVTGPKTKDFTDLNTGGNTNNSSSSSNSGTGTT